MYNFLICLDFYNGGTRVEARADPSTTDLDDPSYDYTAYKDGKSILKLNY